MDTKPPQLSEVEIIKEKSNYLKGTLAESLKNEITGAIYAQDTHLIKFHGSYQQTDRELDAERKHQKLEPLYSFMLRVRVPGGIATAQQWLSMSKLAADWGSDTLKLTTRQAFELHCVLKRNLQTVMQGIYQSGLDTLAACGDVNRNVMCTPHPFASAIHHESQEIARQISAHLTPHTTAYYEIWLDGEHINKTTETETIEPIYGKTYLPRKFKIAIAIPPDNDTDIFANDIGLIAIANPDDTLAGFNVAIGGGMGRTLGDDTTYPRVASVIGYVPKEQIIAVCEQIVTIQRDYGNRESRKHSRLKYTIDRLGLDWFKTELNTRLGWTIADAKSFVFNSNDDRYGWYQGTNGNWFVTLFIEGGRIKNTENYALKTAFDQIAALNCCDFRLTGNQNLILGNISPQDKAPIEELLTQYGILQQLSKSPLRLHSMACVALNLCALANAEAERYLPSLIDKIDQLMAQYQLNNQPITIRMTGCANGCARPYLAEIGLVGRSPGNYNLYLGAAFDGSRLNKLYRETLSETDILTELNQLFKQYATERTPNEHFGDFVLRKNIV
ncbi:MAG: NADPH-dependent assimilatory sulfite reductase hemoprotein subunit [Sphingobacteriales bacterium]|nr:NADPH-dependent assimilatory sulfite reductase hemoprotein subunit [Sphingobacteriales bacterium]